MRAVKDISLAELLLQMRFMPVEKRQAQLEAAEQLIAIIDSSRDYPFEFIWYRITGHRPKSSQPNHLLGGEYLITELCSFIARLSNQIAPRRKDFDQPVYSQQELAERFGVSTKTIDRWRQRGLVARKFIFEDGRKRLGFAESAVERFTAGHPELVDKAKSFNRLTQRQRSDIIKKARNLASKTGKSPHSIIEQIAARTNRAHETIRLIIAEHDAANPSDPIFGESGALTPAQAGEIFRQYKHGVEVGQLMKSFNRSRSTIYRIIKQKRAKAILARRIDFIASDEFEKPNAEKRILDKPLEASIISNSQPLPAVDTSSLKQYLENITNKPALNRQQEQQLFRRYNFLKFMVCKHRPQLHGANTSSRIISKLENYLERAQRIKNTIVEANLGLVVTIANRHRHADRNLIDLVSEGNMALLTAVEKFDYTKGFRFRTYASWVISKDFAKKIPAEHSRPDKAGQVSMEAIEKQLQSTVGHELGAIERARANLVQVIKDNLDQRGQYIIFHHFGLLSTGIRKETKTLQQIGQDLGLTKERVRQLELQALQQLKYYVSQDEFDLLTG